MRLSLLRRDWCVVEADVSGFVGRRTDDGLAIYDISELKIGLGGGESRSSRSQRVG